MTSRDKKIFKTCGNTCFSWEGHDFSQLPPITLIRVFGPRKYGARCLQFVDKQGDCLVQIGQEKSNAQYEWREYSVQQGERIVGFFGQEYSGNLTEFGFLLLNTNNDQ